MALSGAYTFGISTEAVDLIEEAFERCGIDPSAISAQRLLSARRSLGFMFSNWSNDGPKLWNIYQHIITLAEGDPDYDLPANTIYVLDDAFTRQDDGGVNRDLGIGPISRSEYAGYTNKLQESERPTAYYVQRTLTPVLYVWPVLQVGASCSLVLNLVRISQDVGKLSNQIDAPQRAFDAIASDLAYRLAVKFNPQRAADLKVDRDESYALFDIEDRERVPVRIYPDIPDPLS
jgi:hypothetical protein